jgi:1,4-dihydroxy-2-naphthoyl-CoA hydrolase
MDRPPMSAAPGAGRPTLEQMREWSPGHLPGLIGIDITAAEEGRVTAQLPLRPELMAPNGFLHAGAVVSMADTACGYGTMSSLPEGASHFTTIELKANFTATAREGLLLCEATLVHAGRSTQVWDAVVSTDDGRRLAMFRCTQMILYPR